MARYYRDLICLRGFSWGIRAYTRLWGRRPRNTPGSTEPNDGPLPIWPEFEAMRRSADPTQIPAGTAAKHTVLSSRWPLRVLHRAVRVIVPVEPIRAPFPQVPVHVIESPCIGSLFPNRMRRSSAIVDIPCKLSQSILTIPEAIPCPGPSSARIFPLSLRMES